MRKLFRMRELKQTHYDLLMAIDELATSTGGAAGLTEANRTARVKKTHLYAIAGTLERHGYIVLRKDRATVLASITTPGYKLLEVYKTRRGEQRIGGMERLKTEPGEVETIREADRFFRVVREDQVERLELFVKARDMKQAIQKTEMTLPGCTKLHIEQIQIL